MSEDAAPDSVATAYMLIHETLLLFTGIRFFWDAGKYGVLDNALFIKDGPLFLKGQYSKLVIPIRNFFEFAKRKDVYVHVVGQEKTGAFVDHLEIIARQAPSNSLFAPSNEYIRKEIQHRPERSEPYGSRTNYGNKMFVKFDEYHHLVLSVPTGHYTDTASLDVDLPQCHRHPLKQLYPSPRTQSVNDNRVSNDDVADCKTLRSIERHPAWLHRGLGSGGDTRVRL